MRRPNWPQDGKSQYQELLTRCESALKIEGIVVHVRVVGVQARASDNWKSVFSRIDVCRKNEIEHIHRYEYKRLKSVAEVIAGVDFMPRFQAALEGREPMLCGGVPLGPLAPDGTWDAEEHPSHSDYCTWPCFYAERRLDGEKVAAAVEGPFVSAQGYPYLESIWELVSEVASFRVFHGWEDARKGNLHVFIWNYSGRFRDVSLGEKGDIKIELEGNSLETLLVVGRVVTADERQAVDEPAQPCVMVKPTSDAIAAEFALVTASEDILDQWRGELQPSAPQRSVPKLAPDEILDRLLRSGESSFVEFKPYVRLRVDAAKVDEVVETAMAMTNARGGWILIGVNDHGVPVFGADDYKIVSAEASIEVSQSISPDERRESLTRAARSYGAKLRDRIQQRASKSLDLKYDIIWRDHVPVLTLRVAAGVEKPYLDGRDNSIWYRTNATNRRPSEEELAAIFAERLAVSSSD